MSELDLPGLDVSSRVRARDIQMAAVADVRRRVVMISGAVDAPDHDVSMIVELPEPGRWRIIKSETNLTSQTWLAMQATTDEDTHFVDDADSMIMCRQFSRTFLTPDLRRLTFHDGAVRPGESMLKMVDIDCSTGTLAYAYARYCATATDTEEQIAAAMERVIADGMTARPMVESIVPVSIIG